MVLPLCILKGKVLVLEKVTTPSEVVPGMISSMILKSRDAPVISQRF
jgi:hypothetical protein